MWIFHILLLESKISSYRSFGKKFKKIFTRSLVIQVGYEKKFNFPCFPLLLDESSFFLCVCVCVSGHEDTFNLFLQKP